MDLFRFNSRLIDRNPDLVSGYGCLTIPID